MRLSEQKPDSHLKNIWNAEKSDTLIKRDKKSPDYSESIRPS